jgi:hypothetical protein
VQGSDIQGWGTKGSMSEYVPLLTVVTVVINIAIFYFRADRLSTQSPEKRAGYHKIVRVFALYSGALSAIWAVGTSFELGSVVAIERERSVMHHVRPTAFDWLFLFASWLLLFRFSVWLYGRRGAEFLVAHGEIFRSFPERAITVKILWAWMLLVSAGAVMFRLAA